MEKKSFGLISATGKAEKSRSRSATSGRYTAKSSSKAPKIRNVIGKIDERVSASALHRETRPTLDLLQTSDAVAVTHYNEVEGYLVAPHMFVGLIERVEQAEAREDEFTSTVTLLLAAAQTGVPIPSDMLQRVMPNVDVAQKWEEIAQFAATFPVRITAGEHGEPITRAPLSHVSGPIEESGSDEDLYLG